MWDIIGTAAVGALVLLGLCFLLWLAALWLFRVDGGEGEYIMLPIEGHMEDIEFRIRGAAIRRRLTGQSGSVILVVNLGADEETAEIAQRICRQHRQIQFVMRNA